jgi:hypothetical protein
MYPWPHTFAMPSAAGFGPGSHPFPVAMLSMFPFQPSWPMSSPHAVPGASAVTSYGMPTAAVDAVAAYTTAGPVSVPPRSSATAAGATAPPVPVAIVSAALLAAASKAAEAQAHQHPQPHPPLGSEGVDDQVGTGSVTPAGSTAATRGVAARRGSAGSAAAPLPGTATGVGATVMTRATTPPSSPSSPPDSPTRRVVGGRRSRSQRQMVHRCDQPGCPYS